MPIGPVVAAMLIALLAAGWGEEWARRVGISRRWQIALLIAACAGTRWMPGGVSAAATWLPLLAALYLWLQAGGEGKWRVLLALAIGGVAGALTGFALPPGSPGALNIYFLDGHYALAGIALVLALVTGRYPGEQAAIALAVPVAALELLPFVPALHVRPVQMLVRMVGADGGMSLSGPDWWVNAPLLAVVVVALVGALVEAYNNSRRRTVIFRRFGY